ncbi:MAG: NAD(P)-dependent oxidoreductase [Pseudomonadota bacterium]
MPDQTILMTGAAGGVAQMLRPYLRKHYTLRLSDRTPAPVSLEDGETWVTADLTDRAAMPALVKGVAGVVHLGGHSVEADWDTIKLSNIEGLQSILEGCRAEGVPRFIFASSNHAAGFYPRTRRIGVDEAVRPDGFYGVSKAFGEALCSLYADKHGLRAMSIRIGNVSERPADHRRLSIWQHPEDLAQLIGIGLSHEDVHHAIVYGMSHNERAWWDNGTATALGYQPKHNAEDHVSYAMAQQATLPDDRLGDLFQGGGFASKGFTGDPERTLSAKLPRP